MIFLGLILSSLFHSRKTISFFQPCNLLENSKKTALLHKQIILPQSFREIMYTGRG